MQILKDAIQDVMKGLTTQETRDQSKIFELFAKELSRQERKHAKCVSLWQNIVTVNVDSSAWLYQFNQKKDKLVEKTGVKDIRFRIGEVVTKAKKRRR